MLHPLEPPVRMAPLIFWVRHRLEHRPERSAPDERSGRFIPVARCEPGRPLHR
jgi:hypothetical protein